MKTLHDTVDLSACGSCTQPGVRGTGGRAERWLQARTRGSRNIYANKRGCPLGDDDYDNNVVRAARFYESENEYGLFEMAKTVIEAKAPPSSIEEVAARLFAEQLDAADAPLKTVNEMLSDHFKCLIEVTANSAYGAVAQRIDE